MENRPLIGVAVIVIQNQKVLLGKRKGAHGSGTWAFPGGHLEFNESIEECAIREVFEETGLAVKDAQHVSFTNDIFETDKKHYVTLFVKSEYISGEPVVKEPHKCEEWGWFFWTDLPKPLFLSLQNLLSQDINPFG